MLTHKPLVARYLSENYGPFFEHYEKLLKTHNYVTLRQSLKLLSELLLGKYNFELLQRYIADEKNLKVSLYNHNKIWCQISNQEIYFSVKYQNTMYQITKSILKQL